MNIRSSDSVAGIDNEVTTMRERSGHFQDIRQQCKSIIDDLSVVSPDTSRPPEGEATGNPSEPVYRKRKHRRHTPNRAESSHAQGDGVISTLPTPTSGQRTARRESHGTRPQRRHRHKLNYSESSANPLTSPAFICNNEESGEYYPLDLYYKGGGIEGYTNLAVESNDKADKQRNKEITRQSIDGLDVSSRPEKQAELQYEWEDEMEKLREQSRRLKQYAVDSFEGFRKKVPDSVCHRRKVPRKSKSVCARPPGFAEYRIDLTPIKFRRNGMEHDIDETYEKKDPSVDPDEKKFISVSDGKGQTRQSQEDLVDIQAVCVTRVRSVDDLLMDGHNWRTATKTPEKTRPRNCRTPETESRNRIQQPLSQNKECPKTEPIRRRKLGTVTAPPQVPRPLMLQTKKDNVKVQVNKQKPSDNKSKPPQYPVRGARRRGRKNRNDPRWKSEPLTESVSGDDFKSLKGQEEGVSDEDGRSRGRSGSLMDLFRSSLSLARLFRWSKSARATKQSKAAKCIPSERSAKLQEGHPVRRVTVGEPPTALPRDRPHKMLSARSVSEGILNLAPRNNSYKPLVAEDEEDTLSSLRGRNEHRSLKKSLMRISSSDLPHTATNPLMFPQALARTDDAVLFLQGSVPDESSTDPAGELDPEVDSYMSKGRSDSVFLATDVDPLLAPREATQCESTFDITGPSGNARFAWQRDIGVQCTILRGEALRRMSGETDNSRQYSEPVHIPRKMPLSGPTRSLDSISMMEGRRRHMSEVVPPSSPRIREIQEQNPLFQRRRAITLSDSDIELFNETHNSPGTKKKRKNSKKGKKSSTYQRQASLPSPLPTLNTTPTNAIFGHENKTFEDEATLDRLPTDLGARSDTLSSPNVSPVPWLTHSVPELVVTRTSTREQLAGSTQTLSSGRSETRLKTDNFLRVPLRRITMVDIPIMSELKAEEKRAARGGSAPSSPLLSRSLRRNSSGSLHSASDDSDTEPTTPPIQRRGRRQAIFDSKSLASATGPEGDLSPANSCDEGEPSHPPAERMGRKRSSVDLGINYPGDLLVQSRQKKVLIKRNTIADFANTKAYQASTASLISEQGDSKKIKSTFSLLKLIDKKSHRSKDNLTSLTEVLQNLSSRPSTFHSHLSMYKDVHWSELIASKDKDTTSSTNSLEGITENERKRREAVWEFFKSECVFLIDHLMVLKHCFMELMKKVQVEGHMMFAEPNDLFGNLDELCFVSHTFCRDFISLLLKDARSQEFGRTEVLVKALQMFCQLTRDGEVYHDYCLNYSKACTYLEQLRKNEDFCDFEKWCEQDSRCHRLQLSDLLISPMQHCTKVPLLLTNIRKYTEDPDERQQLTDSLEKLEASLQSLEEKMKWLKNFERVQEIQQQIVWQPITELEPRAFIPEVLKNTLNRQPCERLLASPKRQLLHEGPLTLLEISKTIDMYMFLFDDILLLTKVKKPPRKKSAGVDPTNLPNQPQTDGAVFTVHRQPIALDRFTIHDVRPPDATGFWEYVECGVYMPLGVEPKEGMAAQLMEDYNPQRSNLFFGCLSAANGLRNAFVLVQISRFQQIIGVYTLQAPNEQAKTNWMNKLHEAQDQYKEASSRHRRKDSEAGGKSPDKDRAKERKDSRQRSPKPSGSRLGSHPPSPNPADSRHRNSADSTSSDEQYRRISNASTVSTITIKSTGSGFIDDHSAQIDDDNEAGAQAHNRGARLSVDEASGQESASTSPVHSPTSRGRRLSPSRLQKLTMLKAIHEKSQSIDAVYI